MGPETMYRLYPVSSGLMISKNNIVENQHFDNSLKKYHLFYSLLVCWFPLHLLVRRDSSISLNNFTLVNETLYFLHPYPETITFLQYLSLSRCISPSQWKQISPVLVSHCFWQNLSSDDAKRATITFSGPLVWLPRPFNSGTLRWHTARRFESLSGGKIYGAHIAVAAWQYLN